MSPDIEGSINPWNLSGERHNKPEWNHDKYQTPFAAISSFLELWPGDEQTSECDISERHLRLIETVAGYPEILVGRRPLDMPLHPRSKLAFELSNFLDRIQSPNCNSEWHSLRSFLLHADLKMFADNANSEEEHHHKFLHVLLKTIRDNSEFGLHEDFADTLHPDEHRLLTTLHSKSKDRVDAFWPLGDLGGINFNKKLNRNIDLLINDGDSGLSNNPNYIEHTFRLSKIHTWITKWSSTEMFHLNTSHHFPIGASAFLESVIAKMRSNILDEKRPGSIIVDGGGKITYISKNRKEDEKKWMETQLRNILMIDKSIDARKKTHPFQKVIEKNIIQYGHMVEDERKNHLRSAGSHNIQELFKTIADPKNPDGPRIPVPQRTLYEEYIGPDVIKYFFPPISVNHKDEDDNPEWLFEESIKTLEGEKQNLPWQLEKCLVCTNPEEFSLMCEKCEKLTQHRIESGKQICIDCTKTKNAFTNPLKIINQSGFVCQFHLLVYEIGKRTIIRQTSFMTNSGNEINSKKDSKIQWIIVFDGNSIGKIFTEALKKWEEPSLQPNEEEGMQIWRKYQSEIVDINKPWNTCETLISELNSIEEEVLREKVKSKLVNRRLQALIRKQRRSFSFNAGWWVSIASSIAHSGKAITPWIVAGDDTVLASHSENEQDIRALLASFQKELQNQFLDVEGGYVPISFAGAVCKRGKLTIKECYDRAVELEKTAADAWKYQVGSKNKLLTDKKIEELKNLKSKEQKWDVVVRAARWATDSGGLIGEKEVKSLMLFDHWNDHSSS